MRGILNRKQIYDQIPFLATGKIDFVPVFAVLILQIDPILVRIPKVFSKRK